jgi:hypothetical protein
VSRKRTRSSCGKNMALVLSSGLEASIIIRQGRTELKQEHYDS